MRKRWLGATGLEVPEIAVEGSFDLPAEALLVDDVSDAAAIREAHEAGRPIVARAAAAEQVKAALARPEVACVLVPPDRLDLLDLDLTALTYG